MAAQAGLSLTWSKPPKTGFIATRLKLTIIGFVQNVITIMDHAAATVMKKGKPNGIDLVESHSILAYSAIASMKSANELFLKCWQFAVLTIIVNIHACGCDKIHTETYT